MEQCFSFIFLPPVSYMHKHINVFVHPHANNKIFLVKKLFDSFSFYSFSSFHYFFPHSHSGFCHWHRAQHQIKLQYHFHKHEAHDTSRAFLPFYLLFSRVKLLIDVLAFFHFFSFILRIVNFFSRVVVTFFWVASMTRSHKRLLLKSMLIFNICTKLFWV